jgi:hypothetical protein
MPDKVKGVANDMNKYWSRLASGLVPYVPGEQPRDKKYIKLNTNENPYGPSCLQGAGMVITGIISIVIAGGFALLGLLAKKKTRSWVFMVGIIIYSIDTIIFILGADWVGIGFHIWGIYGFTAAFIACTKLKRFTIKQ